MSALLEFLAANPAVLNALGGAAIGVASWFASRWHLGLDGPAVRALKAIDRARAEATGHTFLQDLGILGGRLLAQHPLAPTAPAAK